MKYDRANLLRAFQATQKGMSVYRASREYNVPESTLRDRTRGLVPVDVTVGFKPLFSVDEEEKLVKHISYMADIGYGYNVSKIKYMARDYALHLGKVVKSAESLSDCWFYDFVKRWPNLKIAKPQKLAISRAKSASRQTIDNYYCELESILKEHNLLDKPERIFNIDETGVSTEHQPPKVVCSKDTTPQAVTSPRSSLVTIIAGGNAIGNSIPPYFVFSGKRWNPEFLQDACVGSSGEMTKNGWSNTQVFQNYVTNHFAKYANLSPEIPTLLLYDGHKSHISLTLTQWAERNNVILFVLPPHTSHLTQPLDVGVFGPFKKMYSMACHSYMQQNPGLTISKYSVAALTAKPYMKALSTENLQGAFRKAGIFPFDKTTISDGDLAPAVIYESCKTSDLSQECTPSPMQPSSTNINCETKVTSNTDDQSFFAERTVTKALVKKTQTKVCTSLPHWEFIERKKHRNNGTVCKKNKIRTTVTKSERPYAKHLRSD
ncbi:uncharacterized protein LOC123556821 [Mercenaria mercenaria]|uniref:uncharacterized protein LOC123556821 n=1 Tax=Mercenaria mercenaria TaxID=6596 RepID=UPI00234EF85F|nr:uncharacterized protein LOC123556821 [Mercenaria mercenaria]